MIKEFTILMYDHDHDHEISVIWSVSGIWLDREQSQIGYFYPKQTLLPTCVRNMNWVTIYCKYHDRTRHPTVRPCLDRRLDGVGLAGGQRRGRGPRLQLRVICNQRWFLSVFCLFTYLSISSLLWTISPCFFKQFIQEYIFFLLLDI